MSLDARKLSNQIADQARARCVQRQVDRQQAQDEMAKPTYYQGFNAAQGRAIVQRLGNNPIAIGTPITNGGIAQGQAVDASFSPEFAAIDQMPRMQESKPQQFIPGITGEIWYVSAFTIIGGTGLFAKCKNFENGAQRWKQPVYPTGLSELIGKGGVCDIARNPDTKLVVACGLSNPIDLRDRKYLAISYSNDDGETWTLNRRGDPGRTNTLSSSFFDCACRTSTGILVGRTIGENANLLHSEDGVNWQVYSSAVKPGRLIWGEGKILALGSEGMYRSENDGRSWALTYTLQQGKGVTFASYFEGVGWIAVGKDFSLETSKGFVTLYFSSDLRTWDRYEVIDLDSGFSERDVAFNRNWVLIAADDQIGRARIGSYSQWEFFDNPFPLIEPSERGRLGRQIRGICFSKAIGQFVLMNVFGQISTSRDGKSWKPPVWGANAIRYPAQDPLPDNPIQLGGFAARLIAIK